MPDNPPGLLSAAWTTSLAADPLRAAALANQALAAASAVDLRRIYLSSGPGPLKSASQRALQLERAAQVSALQRLFGALVTGDTQGVLGSLSSGMAEHILKHCTVDRSKIYAIGSPWSNFAPAPGAQLAHLEVITWAPPSLHVAGYTVNAGAVHPFRYTLCVDGDDRICGWQYDPAEGPYAFDGIDPTVVRSTVQALLGAFQPTEVKGVVF